MKNCTKYIYNGIEDSIIGWSKRVGINKETLRRRIKSGWSIEKALTYSTKPAHIRGLKTCSKCKIEKSIDNFHKLSRRNGTEFTSKCKECDRKTCRSARQSIRLQVIKKYSNNTNKCAICKEPRIEVLDIDHINGDGKIDRNKYITNDLFYRYLLANKKRKNLRVLCRNCNWIEHLKHRKWGIQGDQ